MTNHVMPSPALKACHEAINAPVEEPFVPPAPRMVEHVVIKRLDEEHLARLAHFVGKSVVRLPAYLRNIGAFDWPDAQREALEEEFVHSLVTRFAEDQHVVVDSIERGVLKNETRIYLAEALTNQAVLDFTAREVDA